MWIFPSAPTLSSHFQFSSGAAAAAATATVCAMQLFHRLTLALDYRLTSSSFVHICIPCRTDMREFIHKHNYNAATLPRAMHTKKAQASQRSFPFDVSCNCIFDLRFSPPLSRQYVECTLSLLTTLRHFVSIISYYLRCNFFTCTFQNRNKNNYSFVRARPAHTHTRATFQTKQ